ncbi:MAG: class II aldolase/adducin family protein [Deltaproteobacteria bacterium]|nr:class II aldolase/adducin family protein [Deltaproteobacteria bacterium]
MQNREGQHLDERAARSQLAEVAREIYARKLSGAMDGNLSIRLGKDRFVTTPSGVHKGRLTPADMLLVDGAGRVIGTPGKAPDGKWLKPSSELGLHLVSYARRPDVGAVIHAHPPLAIAYTLAGGKLSEPLVSEVIFAVGQIATAPYTTPTTAQVPEVLGDYVACYDCIIMPRHGSVTVGATLDLALARLDALEHTANIACMVKMLGGAPPIQAGEVDRLFDLARPVPPPYRCETNACPPPEPTAARRLDPPAAGELEARLVQEVLRALSQRP